MKRNLILFFLLIVGLLFASAIQAQLSPLPPPELIDTNESLPITLRWDSVQEASSYILNWSPCQEWIKDENEGECLTLSIVPENGVLQPEYNDKDVCLFTRETSYTWSVASCTDENANSCGAFSESKSFTPSGGPKLEKVELLKPVFNPENPIPSVLKTTSLLWSGPACAYFYEVKIIRDSDGNETKFSTKDAQIENVLLGGEGAGSSNIKELQSFWEDSDNFNKTFTWSVSPCWSDLLNLYAVDCNTDAESEKWKFKIVVEKPVLLTPINGISTKIPIILSWQKAAGAVSYKYELAEDAGFNNIVNDNTILKESAVIKYKSPDIIPEKNYWWRVKTCIDTNGDICGEWSEIEKFSTYPLLATSNSIPPDGGEMLFTADVKWQKDNTANAYKYNLQYLCRDETETREECITYQVPLCNDTSGVKQAEPLVLEDIVLSNSFTMPISCLGTYQWSILSCLDKECTITKPSTLTEAPLLSFTMVEPPPSTLIAGIVPCGRTADNLDTPYKEWESCQLKHVGFILQNILDFVVWKLSLLILSVLLMLRIVSIFFSFGDPAIAANIKGALRSFLVGFVILLTAWIIINLIMGFLGFQIEFFGRWWELPF